MKLLNPWSLLWFAPLAAAIIFLYLLKLRRIPRVVSSVLLWMHLAADLQANAPFQKLRRNLLLFIQLLALAVVVAALGRPFVRAAGFEGQSIVLVMDASASMKAKDVSGTRFGEAKRIVLKSVDDLGRGDTMMVIVATAKTNVVMPFTSDKRALATAINALECKDTTTHLEDALRLADSMCARRKSAQIVVLSDGAFAPVANPIVSRAKLSFVKIGKRADNVAITSLGARRVMSGAAGYELFVGTHNFSGENKTFTIEVSRGEQLLDAREQTLAPNLRGAEVFNLPASAAGLVTVKLDNKDDLEADNSATVLLAQMTQASVLLITKGDLFLERALSLDPALNVSKAVTVPATAKSYDLVVVEGLDNLALPRARGYLFINATGPQAPAEPGETVPGPTIVDWSRDDPVMRYLDFAGLHIAEARTAQLRPWAHALAETQSGALIAAGQHAGARSVWVGWDLLRSDFPLRVGFPIFLANCVDWLAGSAGGNEQLVASPGEAITLPATSAVKLQLTYPSGRTAEIANDKGPLMIEDTEAAGVYTVTGKGYRRQFAVNLLNREESNTKPAEQMALGGRTVTGARGSVQSNKELWRWLILLALVLVSLEWIIFHKRP
jgi:Ca-activated chloride channel homolog